MKIFSYGSNMCSPRIAARVPSARFVATGCVRGFSLRFHKRGRLDGSGKANMLRTDDPEDRVWGVIWEIDPADKAGLDRAEGLGNGYDEERVRVVSAPGDASSGVPGGHGARLDDDVGLPLRAYLASPDFIDDGLLPFEWYLDFVVAGAREHGLPDPHVELIARTEARRDPDEERRRRNRAILDVGRSRSGEGTGMRGHP